MPTAGDDINWSAQLNSLNPTFRALIIWVRLSGQIAVILALVGVLIGRDLGLFEDNASRERRQMLNLSIEQHQILKQNQQILTEQLDITKKHTANTEAISRNLCLMIPGLGQSERQRCMNNDRW